MPTLTFHYSHDAASVFRYLSDPATAQKRSEAFGETDIRVSTTNGTVTNVRKVAIEVPSFAKKIVNPVNVVTDVKTWDERTRSAHMSVDIKGVPVTLTGNIRIVPSGAGADYVVDFQVACKIPLLGAQLAKHAAEETAQGMAREHEWNRANLA